MGAKVKWIVGLWTVVAAAVVLGQAGMPVQPGVPAAAPTTAPAVEDAVLPSGPFNGITMDDLLDFLKDKVTGFNSIVIRAAWAPPDYPKFDNFSPKNVTVGQFLDLMRTYPNVDVQQIDGRMGPLYVFRVGFQGPQPQPMFGGAGAPAFPGAGGMGGVSPAGDAADDSAQMVKVYALAEIVNAQGGDAKQSLNNVLSLLQTALDQQGGKVPAALKVHEQTMMLVFKGSAVQMQVLEQALSALQPKPDTSEVAKLKQMYNAAVAQQQVSHDTQEQTISQLRDQLNQMARQTEEYRLQATELDADLAAQKKQTAGTKPKE